MRGAFPNEVAHGHSSSSPDRNFPTPVRTCPERQQKNAALSSSVVGFFIKNKSMLPAYVCVDPVSAVGLVSDGHHSFRCIYILPRITDDVNLQGDVFVFLFDGQGGMSSPGKAHCPRMTGHATYVSDFVSVGRFPSARRTRAEEAEKPCRGRIYKEKGRRKGSLVQEPLLVCYSFPSASSAIISDIFDGKPSYRT